jgi:hypothetical protein
MRAGLESVNVGGNGDGGIFDREPEDILLRYLREKPESESTGPGHRIIIDDSNMSKLVIDGIEQLADGRKREFRYS